MALSTGTQETISEKKWNYSLETYERFLEKKRRTWDILKTTTGSAQIQFPFWNSVPPRVRNRTVADALHELTFYRHKGCSRLAWSSWISGTLGTMSSIALNISEDVHQRRFVSNGIFSTRSAYRAFFIGSTSFEPWKRIWKSWAPGKCKIFIWLAIRNRCWTADRLQKKGLPHPAQCPLCDQEGETVQHLLTFVSLLDNFGLTSYSPWI